MDTQQLKLLAGLVRGLLQPSHPSLAWAMARSDRSAPRAS
jgi:hypothetical protein